MRRWQLVAGYVGLGSALAAAPARAQTRPSAAAEAWTLEAEAQLAPHHGRSFVELGAGLALGTGGYWLLMNRNVADWDNPRPLQRFDGSAWVLDNNSIGVNFLGHPASGGLSYSFARANHQSVLGAFGYSFLTSFLWEFIIEFKEKVSVNDVVVTPGAGLPIGEFFYKLGLYLDSGHPSSTALDLARWTLGTGVALDRRLDGRPAPRAATRDSLGFSSEIWHDFRLRYGVLAVHTPQQPDYALLHAGVAARLVTLPGYGKPTAFGRAFWSADLSSFWVQTQASHHGSGLTFAADTVLLGYHAQSLKRQAQVLEGQAVTFGTSVGWDYFRSSANRYASVERAVGLPQPDIKYHVPNRREQYGALQLPGVAVDVRALRSWGSFEASARLQPSFAGVGAPAFYSWSAANLREKSKHILHRQGYFYGWGGAANVTSSLALGPLRAGFELMYGSYRSQDGLDRHPEQLSVDVPATAEVLRYAGSLGVAPMGGAVSVSLDWGVRRLRSKVGGFETIGRAVQRGLSASWVF